MWDNMNKFNLIIAQRIKSRKKIAEIEQSLINLSSIDKINALFKIKNERAFIRDNLENLTDLELISKICNLRDEKILIPRIGNLLNILRKDIEEENVSLEYKKLPSQNDLTRWALKNAVLKFYINKNLPDDTAIVDSPNDDRLIVALAPDFDVIADLWFEQMDEMCKRNDKYRIEIEEYNRAQDDLNNGMRGSAFEKQLDRFRKEFMQKIKDEFYAGSNYSK